MFQIAKHFARFPHLNSFIHENNLDVNKGVLEHIKRHISILSEEIRQYFPDLKDFQKYFRFVNNRFGTSVGDLPSQDNLLQIQVIDLVDDWKCENRI